MNQKVATILVVEDKERAVRITVPQLEQYGYQVMGPAHNAVEAFSCIRTQRPDLILMDIQPEGGMDGIDTALQLCAEQIPIVFLTPHAGDEVSEWARAAQPLAYLAKPLNQYQLRAAVSIALELARLRRELSVTRDRAQDSEQRLATLTRNLPGMLYRCQAERLCDMQYVSEGCLGLTGYAAEELIASAIQYADLIHPEDRPRVHERVLQAIREHRAYRLLYRMRDRLGQEKWVWEQGRTVQDASGVVQHLEGLILDISDQKHIEQALASTLGDLEQRAAERTTYLSAVNSQLQLEMHERELLHGAFLQSQQRYRDLVESINDWVWEVDVTGVYTYASPRVQELLGYTPEEVLGKTPFELMPEAEARRVGKLFTDIMQGKQPFDGLENVNYHKDGHPVVLESSGVPKFEGGRFVGYRGIDRDISERKAMMSALKASEEQLASILRHTMAVTYVKDLEGRYQMVNPAFEQMIGLPAEQVIGRCDHELFPKEYADHYIAGDQRILQGEKSACFEEEVFIEGVKRIFMTVKFPLLDSEGRVASVCGMSTDITDRLEQAEQERNTLVREVHHRIKNHLQGVVGLLQMERRRYPDFTEAIARAVNQVQSISLIYGLQSSGDSSDMELHAMVMAIFDQVQAVTPAELRASIEMPSVQEIYISAAEAVPIALILNELITNAIKHCRCEERRDCVIVKTEMVRQGMVVRISNQGYLASDFDWVAGKGLGTGLRLLRSLMPRHGVRLEYRQQECSVITELFLMEPLVLAA